jgi:hypothetical protein
VRATGWTEGIDKMKWVNNWEVQSESNPEKFYTVSRADSGEFGCSCPQWVYRKKICKHIQGIMSSLGVEPEESAIANKLRFIAKINLMKLSCNNCAKRVLADCTHLRERGRYQPLTTKNIFYVKGGKDTFYLLGRCCKDYEKEKSE